MASQKNRFIKATTDALVARGYGRIKSRVASEIAYFYFQRDKLEEKTMEKLNNLTEDELWQLKKELDSGQTPEL